MKALENIVLVTIVLEVSKMQLTVVGELEKVGHVLGCATGVTGVGELDVGIPELIEEWVHHSLDSGKTLSRRVLEQFRDQVDRVRVSLPKDLRIVSLWS